MATSQHPRSSSQPSKGSVEPRKSRDWVCKLCGELFRDDKAEVLECEVCDEHFCRKCLNMTAAEYKVLSKRKDIHWYYPPCETKAMKNLKIEKEVELRCKDYFEKLEARLNKLEQKIDDKPNKAEIHSMIKESEERMKNKPDKAEIENLIKESEDKLKNDVATSATSETMDKRLFELRDSQARKNNVIIHSLDEPTAETVDERQEEDEDTAEEICSVLELAPNKVIRTVRLGKRPETPGSNPRPMKVMFVDGHAKERFIEALKSYLLKVASSKTSAYHMT